ncbi:MAG: hypothetical protein J5J00_15705 [Deltaproteobacteria bacterium]|nr:hypothetical protein [Deltaproteobacteria bacterium]
MKIALHAPFGSLNLEGGLMYLIANYLRGSGHEVAQLRCNGTFSLCDRDGETSWKRSLDSCLKCSSEQRSLASWGEIAVKDLSSFLTPGEIVDSRRWLLSTPREQLESLSLRGISLYNLCRGSFAARFGTETPDLNNRKHEPMTRRMLLSAARMCLATRRFLNHFSPEVLLVAGGRDYITRSLLVQAEMQKREYVLFSMDSSQRSINIHHPREDKTLACHLLLTDVTMMRADIKTWPPEVVSEIESVLGFLHIFQAQMSLPLAN